MMNKVDLFCEADIKKPVAVDVNGEPLFIGDKFFADRYPFFSEGDLNYVGQIYYCQRDMMVCYEMQIVSDRVRGCAVGSGLVEVIGEGIKLTKYVIGDK